MKHFAAHFVFDGTTFHKNSCLSFDDEGKLVEVGPDNSGTEERERMIFLNGILCPYFDVDDLYANILPLREFLVSRNLHFGEMSRLPVVLLEGVDLQTMNFTENTIAREIY